MNIRLFTLRSHPDLTRFEVEDGLVRDASADLFSEESTINEVGIDLSLLQLAKSKSDPLGSIDSMVTISADNAADIDAERFAELCANTATVEASWEVDIENVSELEKAWLGTATPGSKVTAFFSSSAAGSQNYRKNITDIVGKIVTELGDVGSRAVFLNDLSNAPFSTAVSFWFPNVDAARDAVAGSALIPLTEAAIIDSESLGLFEGLEHRVFPNPNIWSTTTGLRPPEHE